MKETETLISYRKPELLGTIPPDGIPKLAFGITPLSGFYAAGDGDRPLTTRPLDHVGSDCAAELVLAPLPEPLDHVGSDYADEPNGIRIYQGFR